MLLYGKRTLTMKIEPKFVRQPDKPEPLIHDLAYNKTALYDKFRLMFFGGILTFIVNAFRKNWGEAFFGPASNCYSVAASAKGMLASKRGRFEKLCWKALAGISLLQGIPLCLIGKKFNLVRSDSDYDVVAAYELEVLKWPISALNTAEAGLKKYPDSILLKRRRVTCHIRLGHMQNSMKQHLRELGELAAQERISEPVMYVRLGLVLVMGWGYLRNQEKFDAWYEQTHLEASKHCPDQLSKLAVVKKEFNPNRPF
jgi:hypothetical protein